MAIDIKTHAVDGVSYGEPFLSIEAGVTVPVQIAALTAAEKDARGYLKPGVPFKVDGSLCSGAANEEVFGVTIEPVKLNKSTGTQLVAVRCFGYVLKGVCEDNLSRALTANEIAALGRSKRLLLVG